MDVVVSQRLFDPELNKKSRNSPELSSEDDSLPEPAVEVYASNASDLPIERDTVDLVVTSPPYWRKRDYGIEDQLGQESTPQQYISALLGCLKEWRRVLRPTGSVFINIGDTYWKRSLAGVPGLLECGARDEGWVIRNRIIWAKNGGMPEPAKDRLASRYEVILHLTGRSEYYYDLHGYSMRYGNGTNPGDVWSFSPDRHMGQHLAPFPEELVERAIVLACPREVCSQCGRPRVRLVERTTELDPSRPQAVRAMALAKERGLTNEHLLAIQATGISDAGKALKTQNGTGRNAARVQELAAEAKQVLGGYFREFTFAKRRTVGWSDCGCGAETTAGTVLDPFMGTGTTLRVASRLSRNSIGVDLKPEWPGSRT